MIIGFCVTSCVHEKKTISETKKETKMKISNKQKAIALLKSIETGTKEPISYINATKYIQHNLSVADGLAGFGEVLSHLPPNTAKVTTKRAFVDGDYVFTHTDYNFSGSKIGFDIFKFENGKIIEHWDNLQVKPKSLNPSNRSMIDGSTEIKDLDKTTQNKTIVHNFITDVLVNGNLNKLQSYFDGDYYLQHNPQVADGLSGLGKALKDMASHGFFMKYQTIHKVLGEGNFVLAVSEGTFANEATSFYDLFRLENGKIAEHWDVIETIIPESERKNKNGKFGF